MRPIVLTPVYNEAETVLDILERAWPFADMLVVVDDGSTDGTRDLVGAWAQSRHGVVVLNHATNEGMSGALLTGFAYLSDLLEQGFLDGRDAVVTLDADGQHLPEEIPKAVRTFEAENLDVLLGRRDLSRYPWAKRVGNWGLTHWARLLTGFPYQDVECGFRLMRLDVLRATLPFFTGRRYGCAQEIAIITARLHFRISNDFRCTVAFYRKGARLRDGVNNLLMGLGAFLRVAFVRPYPKTRRLPSIEAGMWPRTAGPGKAPSS